MHSVESIQIKKHSKVGYGIPSGSKENNRVHALGVLLTRIIDTEVDNCNQTSGSKTWRCNMQFVNRVGFLNKSKDTQGLCCPRLENKSISEHVGFKIEIPRWIKPLHSNSQLDTNIHSSTNNGDDSLFKILTVVSVSKNPGVKNVKSDSDPKARRQMKQPMDRIGFINGNSCN